MRDRTWNMMHRLKNSLHRSLEKNAPEVKAFLAGQMPSFLTGIRGTDRFSEVPVFVFHEVEPESLERQFVYLRSNGYSTMTADELEEAARGGRGNGREIALTFDDGTWTFWTYAFPLLKKYGFRAILFAIPGIIREDPTWYPNLDDVWNGRCNRDELYKRGTIQPLCTWRELTIMNESGIVDIQSHSLTHVRVPIAPRLVDFLHPGFRTYICNFNVPLSILDDPECARRDPGLGAPLFESAPRLTCRLRFREAGELVQRLTGYVAKHGGVEFFNRSGWRKELTTVFRSWSIKALGNFETPEDMEAAVTIELAKSKKILEERLNKQVLHFAYPWHAGSSMADRLAAQVGYRTVHYGPDIPIRNRRHQRRLARVRRISKEYLFRLTGNGRLSIWSIWKDRARRFVTGMKGSEITKQGNTDHHR